MGRGFCGLAPLAGGAGTVGGLWVIGAEGLPVAGLFEPRTMRNLLPTGLPSGPNCRFGSGGAAAFGCSALGWAAGGLGSAIRSAGAGAAAMAVGGAGAAAEGATGAGSP